MGGNQRHAALVRNHAVKPRVCFGIQMKQAPAAVRFIRRQHICAVLGIGNDGIVRVDAGAVKSRKKIIHNFVRCAHTGNGQL